MRTALRAIVLLWLWSSFHGPVAGTTGATGVADAPRVQVAAQKSADSLEQVWSLPGSWGGIVTDERTGNVLATTRAALIEIDSTGRTVRETPFRASSKLRSAKLASGQALLSFSTWSPQLSVYDEKGALLWAYPPATSSGIDDVAAVDLDGDGHDEVVIGFNGSTGVHVLDSKGAVVWTSTAIGNVWHVAGGDVRGNGKPQVVTTSAAGQVHIFTADGSERVNIVPGFYADMVRVGRISDRDKAATIFAVGRPSARSTTLNVAAFAADGAKKWESSIAANDTASAQSATVATTKPWLAVSLRTGQVFVLDTTSGAVVGSVDAQGAAELAWLQEKSGGAPLLIVSSPTGVRAFRVKAGTPTGR